MPSLVETLTSLALDPSVVEALVGGFSGLSGRASGLPTEGLGQLTSAAARLSLPDPQALAGRGGAALAELVSGGLRSPDALWSALTDPLGGLEQSLGQGLRSALGGSFEGLRRAADALPADPQALLGPLAEPLRQVVATLGETPELQRVQELATQIESLRSRLASAPAELAALVQEQLQAALDEATALVRPELQHLERLLDGLAQRIDPAGLRTRLEAALFRLVPEAGTPLAEAVATLDLASLDAVLAVDAEVRAARVLVEDLGRDAAERLEGAGVALGAFRPEAWIQRLTSAAALAATSTVTDAAEAFGRWRDGLSTVREALAGFSPDALLAPVREQVAAVGSTLQGVDLGAAGLAVSEAVAAAQGLVGTIQDAQLDVLAGLRDAAASISGAVDAVDLGQVVGGFENALSALDPTLAEVQSAVDSVASAAEGAIASLTTELQTLRTNLTDPAGSFRQPLEDFLTSIRDAIPDGIPAALEEAGQTVADAVSGLDGIALDPVFDAVVGELEDMRSELQGVDAGSLGPLLQAALAAALAVFESFDFQGEVEEFLVEKFDEAVAAATEPVIALLQEQVDGVFGFLREHDPALLFETLGLLDAYDEMVAALASFRPSEVLTPALAEVRSAADRLEGFTPARLLEPIAGPLDQVRRFVDGLSLAPLFGRLQETLGRVTGLLAELDVRPTIDRLAAVVDRLRQSLEGLLTVEGLLEFLRPIHQAALDAVDALDPARLLAPVTGFRQTLLDAIDAADTTSLTGAFQAVAGAVDRYALPALRTDLGSRVGSLASGLDGLDLRGGLRQLQDAQRDLRHALEARGVQPDAEAEAGRQRLLHSIEALDPLAPFARALDGLRTVQAGVTSLGQTLDAALADGDGALGTVFDTLSGRLQDLALGLGQGTTDLKQALRGVVERGYEALGVSDVEGLFAELRQAVESFGPDRVEAALHECLAPVRAFLEGLPDPAALLGDAADSFDELVAAVDPGLSQFLDQVRDDVEPVLDAVAAKVQSLDPAALLAPLEERYGRLLDVKDSLLQTLQDLLTVLDAPYGEIEALAEELNPATVLVAPLNETYQQILDKLGEIDIRLVFQPVIDAVKGLRDQLVEGIDRTSDAFEAFLGAAPSSAGAGASL
ncbi:MAG: hypothetical protein HZB55_07300 [Deltaproteobacteria bacterium]|nr:hypothetical protein [Deltaproteobacteria bacterium]